MVESLDQIKGRIAQFQKEKPHYRDILDLYAQILGEQTKIQSQLKITVPQVDQKLMQSQLNKGIPLLDREKFAIDLEVGQRLFHTLSATSQGATSKMGDEIPRITKAIESGNLNLEGLLSKHYDGDYITQEAEHCGVDKGVLSFLVHVSVRPSIVAQMEQLKDSLNLEEWLQGRCPICGSPPQIAQLRDEEGKRYLLCSLCGCQWRWERIACPYCSNKDHKSLHYLYAEDEEAYRVDLCDLCKGYIKTIDSRKLGYDPYLDLEDVVTIHLDIIAMEKGYRRSAPTPWGPWPLRGEDALGSA